MRFSSERIFAAMALLAGLSFFSGSSRAQTPDDPDPTRITTVDGLHLWAKWYVGGKNQNSDTVILVHNYGSESSKGPWETLAKALQKEGYSVLQFDLRGHGKSSDFKLFDEKDKFVAITYNKLAGSGMNPKAIKDLKAARFSPAYFPYLVNDIVAARRFVDIKHDIPECNSNRVYIIAEQNACPLVMLWMAAEFDRQGNGPANIMTPVNKYVAGKDIAGAVFLSWGHAPIQGSTSVVNLVNKAMNSKVFFSDSDFIGDMLRKKVAMAFMYGKEDRASAIEARKWFTAFKIPEGKKDDAETVKYIVEIPQAEKIAGIKLLEIMEDKKFEVKKLVDGKEEVETVVKKVSVVENQILAFLKKTKTKGINGQDYQEKRYATNNDFNPTPLDKWGLK